MTFRAELSIPVTRRHSLKLGAWKRGAFHTTIERMRLLRIAAMIALLPACGRVGYDATAARDAAREDAPGLDAAVDAFAPDAAIDAFGPDAAVDAFGPDTAIDAGGCAPPLVEVAGRGCHPPLSLEVTAAIGARASTLRTTVNGPAELHVVLKVSDTVSPYDVDTLLGLGASATGSVTVASTTDLVVRHTEDTDHVAYVVAHRQLADGTREAVIETKTSRTRALFSERTFSHRGLDTNETLVYLPDAYEADDSVLHPAILFLHGWGGAINRMSADELPMDDGLMARLIVEPMRYVDFPFVIVAPHCRESVQGGCWGWANDGLAIAALDDAMDAIRIDPARVYVTGLSTGGQGAFELASRHPTRFAAAVPVASTYAESTPICGMLDIPVWAFHGEFDTLQPPSNTQRYVDRLATSCPTRPVEAPTLTLLPCRFGTSDHCGWIEAYDSTHGATVGGHATIFDWMLAHTR
jgi:pimeloyl-ACP methyl ester carboxylesterase